MSPAIIDNTPREPDTALRLGILVSGTGTILQGLIQACQGGGLNATIELVLSNNKDAPAVERARKAGLNVRVLSSEAFPSAAEHSAAIVAALKQRDVELICLGGFSGPVDEQLVEAYPNRVLRTHGSLLPAFPELHPVRAAIASGARITGCTLSFIDEAGRPGPIFLQSAVAIGRDDDEEALAVRVQVLQQRSFVVGLRLITQGQVHIDHGRVNIDQDVDPDRHLEWIASNDSKVL